MLFRELRWRDSSNAAVGSNFVVILAPSTDFGARLVQGLEPVLVQALFSELAVEALDGAVLHRPSRLDQDVADVMTLRPADKRPTGELRSVVNTQ